MLKDSGSPLLGWGKRLCEREKISAKRWKGFKGLHKREGRVPENSKLCRGGFQKTLGKGWEEGGWDLEFLSC